MLKTNTLRKFRRTNLIISRFNNVREIKLQLLGCRSCFATSDFSEHPKNPMNKPHTKVCGKLKGFFDIYNVVDLELNIGDGNSSYCLKVEVSLPLIK